MVREYIPQFFLAVFLVQCTPHPDGFGQSKHGEQSVQIVLEGVEVRQYKKMEHQFVFSAGRLTIEENKGMLKASGDVQGRLENIMWPRKEVGK